MHGTCRFFDPKSAPDFGYLAAGVCRYAGRVTHQRHTRYADRAGGATPRGSRGKVASLGSARSPFGVEGGRVVGRLDGSRRIERADGASASELHAFLDVHL